MHRRQTKCILTVVTSGKENEVERGEALMSYYI